VSFSAPKLPAAAEALVFASFTSFSGMVYANTAINEAAPLLGDVGSQNVKHPNRVIVLTLFAAIGGFLFG
jgi:hypothetical protein